MGQASVQACSGVLFKRSSRMKRKQSVKKVEGEKEKEAVLGASCCDAAMAGGTRRLDGL